MSIYYKKIIGEPQENIIEIAEINGLTIADKNAVLKSVLISWNVFNEGFLIGNASLTFRSDIFLLDLFFVDIFFRRIGIGKQLINYMIIHINNNMINTIYSFTKEPYILEKLGGIKIEDEYFLNKIKAIYKEDCDNCSDYRKSCFPSVVSFS